MMPYLRSLALRAWRGEETAVDVVIAALNFIAQFVGIVAVRLVPDLSGMILVAMVALTVLSEKGIRRHWLHSPPGGALLVVAPLLGQRRRRVLEQNIRDMRDEVFEALSAGRLGEARLIHLKWLAVCWLDVLRTPWLLLAGVAELARKLAGGGS